MAKHTISLVVNQLLSLCQFIQCLKNIQISFSAIRCFISTFTVLMTIKFDIKDLLEQPHIKLNFILIEGSGDTLDLVSVTVSEKS